MIDIRNLSRRRFLELSAAGVCWVVQLPDRHRPRRSAAAVARTVIAFGYVGPTSDEGWTWTHEQGRQAVQEAFPKAKTIFVENIPYSADASRTFRQFVSEGANMVITNSNYGDFMYDIAKNAPETAFLHCDDRTMMDNMGVFYPSHWYPSYVTGVAAGMMTKTNKLGYIASFPVPTTFTGSNAFLMGARSVKPDATLQVIVINSWFDPQASTQASGCSTTLTCCSASWMSPATGRRAAQRQGGDAQRRQPRNGPNAYVNRSCSTSASSTWIR